MNESPSQYAARISGYVKGKDHLKVLQSTAGKLQRLVRGKPTKALTKRPQPERWSAGEILAHLAESEIVIAFRLRLVASMNGIPIQPYDQNLWQANAGYLKKNPKRTLELFRTLRENNVAFVKSLPKERWEWYGMHGERGQESIVRMLELYAGHDINHLTQLGQLLKGKRR